MANAVNASNDHPGVSSEKVLPSEKAAAVGEPHKNNHGENHDRGHSDPFSMILLELAVIIILAIFGRWVADRHNQPAVLGELFIGVAVGNIGYYLEIPLFVLIMHLDSATGIFNLVLSSGLNVYDAAHQIFSQEELIPGHIGQQIVDIMGSSGAFEYCIMVFALWLFSSYGVILLLFMVGLETSIDEMVKVGPKSFMVAIVGVAAPFFLGYGSGLCLLPTAPFSVHLFLAATLCATSVGITARVFKDLDRIQTPEAKIILGAAVIDDVLGLIILAVVVGVVVSGEFHISEVIKITLLSVIFFAVIFKLGEKIIRLNLKIISRMERQNLKLLFPLAFAFALSWLANLIGLASIVGAFAAGLILHEELFSEHFDKRKIEQFVAPLEALFAPVFFVLMGMQVNLQTIMEPGTVKMAMLFTIVAVIGKIVSGIPGGKENDRLSIGIGMIPRGEVGLIFASVGKGLGVVTASVFSAVVIMVIVTTLITPLVLKWSLFRNKLKPTNDVFVNPD